MTAAGTGHALPAVLADALARLASAGLDLDPASRARLAALEGRRVQITAAAPPPLPPWQVGLTVRGGALDVRFGALDRPHVAVRGTPLELAAWLAGAEAAPGATGRGLAIDGDSTVLQELAAVLRGFRPDLGSPLARVLGPELAARALGGAELAAAALRSALEGAGTSLKRGAADTFVDRADAERFLDQLDDLRLRTDRLAARVEAEERRRASS